MAFVQLMAVCLVVILWATLLDVQPMVASSSIHSFTIMSLSCVGGWLYFLVRRFVGYMGDLASLRVVRSVLLGLLFGCYGRS